MSQSTLAIDGGPPIFDSPSLEWPIADDAVRNTINAAIEDGSWGQYDGKWTEQLCDILQSRFRQENAWLCSSGTIAVELALRGAGVRAGGEVILAGYDFPGNFRAIEAIGATPVLVDVIAGGWTMDPQQLPAAFSDLTTAVIVSHLHGQIADIESIRQSIASWNESAEKKIVLVEDTCQAPGGIWQGRPLGSFGDVSVFSFGGSKLLSAGRGGAIISNDPAIIQRAKIYAQRGNDAFPMSQLQAAALIPQFELLELRTQTRAASAKRLIDATSKLAGLSPLNQIITKATPGIYKLPWLLDEDNLNWNRSGFLAALVAEGIIIGEGFRGFTRRSTRRCRKAGSLEQSQLAADRTVLLHHPILLQPNSVVDQVAEAMIKVASQSR